MMVKGEAPASVQCAALRALGQVLDSIDTVPPSDAKIFNECAASQHAFHHNPLWYIISIDCPRRFMQKNACPCS